MMNGNGRGLLLAKCRQKDSGTTVSGIHGASDGKEKGGAIDSGGRGCNVRKRKYFPGSANTELLSGVGMTEGGGQNGGGMGGRRISLKDGDTNILKLKGFPAKSIKEGSTSRKRGIRRTLLLPLGKSKKRKSVACDTRGIVKRSNIIRGGGTHGETSCAEIGDSEGGWRQTAGKGVTRRGEKNPCRKTSKLTRLRERGQG